MSKVKYLPKNCCVKDEQIFLDKYHVTKSNRPAFVRNVTSLKKHVKQKFAV